MLTTSVTAAATVSNNRRLIKLGVITPPDGIFGYDRVISATTMALKDAQENGHLADYDIRSVDNYDRLVVCLIYIIIH